MVLVGHRREIFLAAKHFLPTEIVSSDYCRALVDDDINSLAATADAFDVLRHVIGKRLKRGRLTVVDATNVQPEDRKSSSLWHENGTVCQRRSFWICRKRSSSLARATDDRDFGMHVIRRQLGQFRRNIRGLNVKVFVLFTRLNPLRKLNRSFLNGSDCGIIKKISMDPLTSLAMSMAA